MLISETYRELNRQLHETNASYGNDNFGWSRYAKNLAEKNGYTSVLDYGCGKGNLARVMAETGIPVAEYDPAVAGKDSPPEPAEMVVCTDVLEHIEPVHLNAVLRDLRRLTKKRLFATIACCPASKTLADGRNAHLLVKPPAWWREKLLEHFQILLWEERGPTVAVELVTKKHTGRIRPAARRAVPPQMNAFLQNICNNVNQNSDTFSQIKTVRMWEGIDDEIADMHGACDVIENLDDIDEAFGNLASLSMKCVFVAVKTSDLHTEHDWQRVMEKRFRIGTWEKADGRVMMLGTPGVMVQGITAVGAVGTDDRWINVAAATKRYQGRIEPAAEHGRTAIVACYGPSLKDTIEQLRAEAAKPDVDVISVSGSHDFLLSHGITPRFHIECDPRPHKALNIDKSHPEVTYLIASVCHEEYFERLGPDANIKIWHVSTTDHQARIVEELKEDPRHIISGGGSVGLRSIPLLYAMGYRDLHIHAMDCSFQGSGETVQQWAGKHAGKKQDLCEVMCDGVMFISSPILLTYATNFFETVQRVADLQVRLYGRGLLQSMCDYYMRQQVDEKSFMKRIESCGDSQDEEKVA